MGIKELELKNWKYKVFYGGKKYVHPCARITIPLPFSPVDFIGLGEKNIKKRQIRFPDTFALIWLYVCSNTYLERIYNFFFDTTIFLKGNKNCFLKRFSFFKVYHFFKSCFSNFQVWFLFNYWSNNDKKL